VIFQRTLTSDEPDRAAFRSLLGHLAQHVDGADEVDCAECAELRHSYQQDMLGRRAEHLDPETEAPRYRWRRPSRWLDAFCDLPWVLVDNVGDDSDPAFMRRLYLAVFLSFGLAVALWLVAWVMR
jgi:hypothetical protein